MVLGLIIDAFGELRKKDDSVTDELKNKCFICGLSKTEFNSPHEFDNHTKNHHSMRDYMYVNYLILMSVICISHQLNDVHLTINICPSSYLCIH